MFKDSLVRQIKRLDKSEYNIFIKNVVSYHKEILKRKNARPNEIENAIRKLMNGETRSVNFDYLDSYTYALEKVRERNKRLGISTFNKQPESWKELIDNITTEISLPIDIDLMMNNIDDEDAKTIQTIIKNIITTCANSDENELKDNLKTVERFFDLPFKANSEKY